MADVYTKIAQTLKAMQGVQSALLFYAEVTAVDGESCTVSVQGMELSDVSLRAAIDEEEGCLVLEPAVGSLVLVGDLSGGAVRQLCVLKCSRVAKIHGRVDEVVLNNGDNGGLVNVQPLKEWMQKVEADFKTLQTALSTSPIVGNGAPAAIVFNPTTSSVASKIEDETIKH